MIENPDRFYRFIQSEQPPDQSVDGISWRRSDGEWFVWDTTNTRWVSPFAKHWDFSSQQDWSGVGGGAIILGRTAENSHNAIGQNLRPQQSLTVQQLVINAQDVPPSDAGLDVRNDVLTEHTLNWDGSNKWETVDGLDIVFDGLFEVDPPDEAWFQFDVGSDDPGNNQRMRGTAWYKWIVPGG